MLTTALLTFIVMAGFTSGDSNAGKVKIPEDVKNVLEKRCWGCHNTESKNEKGRTKLSFDKIGELKKAKAIAAMDEIVEVMKEGEMPPAKFLEKYPEKACTDEEATVIIDWANSYLD